MVVVLVGVHRAVGMDMRMHMPTAAGPRPIGPHESPDKVGQAEADQEPAGRVAAEGLQIFQPHQSDPQSDTHQTDCHAAGYVPEAAGRRDGEGARDRPVARPGHCRKRHIMIGAQNRVDGPHRECRRAERQRLGGTDFNGHRRLAPRPAEPVGR